MARESGIGDEQFAAAINVHPVNAEIGVAFWAVGAIPSQWSVGDNEFGLSEWVWILKEFTVLAVVIDALGFGRPNRSNKLSTGIFLASFGRIEDAEFAGLGGVMTGEDRHYFFSAGNAAGMADCRGEPGIVFVEFGLGGAIGIHLKQGLREHLTAIVVVPAHVNDPAIIEDLRVDGVHLIETKPAEVTAVGVAGVEIADLGPPAIDRLNATG